MHLCAAPTASRHQSPSRTPQIWLPPDTHPRASKRTGSQVNGEDDDALGGPDRPTKNDFDGEEETAYKSSLVQSDFSIPDSRLFDIYATTEDVINDVSRFAPGLSPQNENIAAFVQLVKEQVRTAPPLYIPVHQENQTTWPSINPTMDSMWQGSVEGERQLHLPKNELPIGFTMEPESLVKPFGSLDDPLLVVSSYPTNDPMSTVHLAYGTTNDMSSICMFMMYMKLGLHNATTQPHGMLHIDIFPRRVDRKSIPGATVSRKSVMRTIQKVLREYWETSAFEYIAWSNARVGIVFGHWASESYQTYLKLARIPHDTIWLTGRRRHHEELPCACVEYSHDGKNIQRIMFGVFHTE